MKENLEKILNTLQASISKPCPFETLNPLEGDILNLFIRGYTNPKIEKILYKSGSTIRTHLKNLYRKVGLWKEPGRNKSKLVTTLYLAYRPESFLNSYNEEELENARLIDDLTPRQLTVLEYNVKNYSYKKIADTLGISKNTIKKHLKDIFSKLYIEEGVKKGAMAMRLYILCFPEIIPSLYSQVKHLSVHKWEPPPKKKITIEPILSGITLHYNFSSRELEIAHKISKGRSNGEIAQSLFISKYAVRSHISNINKKWNIELPVGGDSQVRQIARQQIYAKALESFDGRIISSKQQS